MSVMRRRLYAIGAGETGCPPPEMKNLGIIESYNNWGSAWYTIWAFECHGTTFVCGLYSEGTEGKGVTASCSERYDGPTRNTRSSKDPSERPTTGPLLGEHAAGLDALRARMLDYKPSFEACRGWAGDPADPTPITGEVRVSYSIDGEGDTRDLSFTETTPAGVGSCVRDVVDDVRILHKT